MIHSSFQANSSMFTTDKQRRFVQIIVHSTLLFCLVLSDGVEGAEFDVTSNQYHNISNHTDNSNQLSANLRRLKRPFSNTPDYEYHANPSSKITHQNQSQRFSLDYDDPHQLSNITESQVSRETVCDNWFRFNFISKQFKQIELFALIAFGALILLIVLAIALKRKDLALNKSFSSTGKKIFYRFEDFQFNTSDENARINEERKVSHQFVAFENSENLFPVSAPDCIPTSRQAELGPSNRFSFKKLRINHNQLKIGPMENAISYFPSQIEDNKAKCTKKYIPLQVPNQTDKNSNLIQSARSSFKGLSVEIYSENILKCSQCLSGDSESNSKVLQLANFNTNHRHVAKLKNRVVMLSHAFKTNCKINWNHQTRKLIASLAEIDHANVVTFIGIMSARIEEINQTAKKEGCFFASQDSNDSYSTASNQNMSNVQTTNKMTFVQNLVCSERSNFGECIPTKDTTSETSNSSTANKLNISSLSSKAPSSRDQNITESCWHHYLVWNHYSRGSLADVIRDSAIKVNWQIKLSLLSDIVQGIKYLHESNLVECHGWLNSRNCFIDDRWQLKISAFGLNQLFENEIQIDRQELAAEKRNKLELLWQAPECLRQAEAPIKGTLESDIYSLSMIIYEMLTEHDPYFSYADQYSIDEILDLIKQNPLTTIHNPFRPEIFGYIRQKYDLKIIVELMCKCWSEQPEDRPSLKSIHNLFVILNGECSKNLMDKMINKLDMFSKNMENLVRQKTEELELQKKKSEDLLYKVFPRPVADSLKTGTFVQPEKFESVTIFFSDIVGFTTISSYSEPIQVISVLNQLFTEFDKILHHFDVFKVETIGDAYMVVSGLPTPNTDHAEQIATMALEILHFCTRFKIQHMPTIPIRVRIGIHTGSVVSGVIGTANPRYCLFGDSVNIASRLESTGLPNTIHISHSTEKLLRENNDYVLKYRGEISLRGRGMYPTYWLLGKKNFDKYLPDVKLEITSNHGINDESIFTSIGLHRQQV